MASGYSSLSSNFSQQSSLSNTSTISSLFVLSRNFRKASTAALKIFNNHNIVQCKTEEEGEKML